MRTVVFLLSATLLMSSALAAPETPYTMADFSRVHKIDAHVHYNVTDDAFLALARNDNFELVSVNVDYPDFPKIDDQAKVAHTLYARDKAHFHFLTTFPMKGFGKAGWAEQTIRRIEAEKATGAVGVKIWKNVGLVETDDKGRKIMLDNPGLDSVFDRMVELHLPLLNHQGEPKNCWLPLDQMTTDNDREYFKAHPGYYMYLHPEGPAYETLMSVRDKLVAKHPQLSYVGAHMASLEWSVDRLADFLDRFPNANVDLTARMSQVMYQSARDYQKVRNFFIKYQDRLMYATDLTLNPGNDKAQFIRDAQAFWEKDWRYLATGESQHVAELKANIKGLALPRAVVDKIYERNARRIYLARR